MSRRKHQLWLAVGFGLFCISLAVQPAHADVRRTGVWPDQNSEIVSLTFEGPRSKALRALASAAGWSIIDNPGSATFAGAGDMVNVYVTDQPAAKVLELLLNDGDYVVKRDGKLLSVTVHAQGGAKADESALPAPPPFPQPSDADKDARPPLVKAEDRAVFGSKLVVAREEVVNDLSVFGGKADLHGTVQGDVLVMGGSLKVHDGARVYGDVGVLGGKLELESGARVDGDLSSAGGHIERASGAIVKGEDTQLGGSKSDKLTEHDDDDDQDKDADEQEEDTVKEDSWSFASVMDKLGSALSRAALLYAFGCILLATAGQPMERMRQELAERPVRALGVGAVALVAGLFALVLLLVTIIGIPVAFVVGLAGVLGVYAGMCAVFLELGALVLEDRTESPYAHLALGCLMYLIFSTLPVIGWLATALAVVVGLGLLVSTRFAGLIGRPPTQLPNAAST
jgi:cytoskeletal protein CcmA (bactofilin family)